MALHCMPGEFKYEGLLMTGVMITPTFLDKVRKLRLSSKDILVATYVKSGTTWMKYLLYLMKNGGEQKEDDSDLILKEIRYLEFIFPGENEDDLIKTFQEKPSPRLFATHLPLRLLKTQVLEDKVKVVVVIRNPKDTLVSLYHFYKMMSTLGFFEGTWDEFFELMKVKPFFEDIFESIVEWWKIRNLDNVLVVRYEEMKENLAGIVWKVAEFTGFELSDASLENIVRLGSFELMKDNPRVNAMRAAEAGFCDFKKSKWIRKGEIGDWVNYFSKEQSNYIDAKCEEICTPLGLTFQWHGRNVDDRSISRTDDF